MKLFHRTDYWGSSIEGRARLGHAARHTYGPYTFIDAQAVTEDRVHGDFCGCCLHRGKRVLEMDETHFLETYDGFWELFHIRTCLGENRYFHDFILIPAPQVVFKGPGWTRLGSVRAGLARMSLGHFLRPFLISNAIREAGAILHHAHVAIVMSSLRVVHKPRNALKRSNRRRLRANRKVTQDFKSVSLTL